MPRAIITCICGNPQCEISYGKCHCGCGLRTNISPNTQRKFGWKAGMPRMFCMGHKKRRSLIVYGPFKLDGVVCVLIGLTQRQYTIIEQRDVELLAGAKLSALYSPTTRGFYAVICRMVDGKFRRDPLARFLINAKPGELVDHRNGETLLNIRSNLRIADKAGNRQNCRASEHSSRFKGVCKGSTPGKWRAQITVAGIKHYLGEHDSEEIAAQIYDEAAQRLHGEFARINHVR